MKKAYVETTILTDVLLKPGTNKQSKARAALARYDETQLPVYSIKELKAGPLDRYAWVHDKLVQTKSLADTLTAVSSINPYFDGRRKNTALEALAAAARLDASGSTAESQIAPTSRDQENADRYRLALAKLIISSWKKRRRVATRTIQELDCYIEASPRLDRRTGFFDLSPQRCSFTKQCCLEDALKADKPSLIALRDSIPVSTRKEDTARRNVLKQLVHQPQKHLTDEECSRLGDALFAFFCPSDAVILTTNISDHEPLAKSIGKKADPP